MNLHELNYPMFETTKAEKKILKKASGLLTLEEDKYFLCIVLEDNFKMEDISGILEKIRALRVGVLCGKLNVKVHGEDRVNLRKIWIEKLLNYTGETL